MTLSDSAANRNNGAKGIVVRTCNPVFQVIIELASREVWHLHSDVVDLVDRILRGMCSPAYRCTPGAMRPVVAIPHNGGLRYAPMLILAHERLPPEPMSLEAARQGVPHTYRQFALDSNVRIGVHPDIEDTENGTPVHDWTCDGVLPRPLVPTQTPLHAPPLAATTPAPQSPCPAPTPDGNAGSASDGNPAEPVATPTPPLPASNSNTCATPGFGFWVRSLGSFTA